jgi:hypothetical protein
MGKTAATKTKTKPKTPIRKAPAKPKTTAEKPTAKPKQTVKAKPKISRGKAAPKKKESTAILEKTRKIDTTIIDFCGVNLNAKLRLFLAHYLTPGSSCFHNAFQAALSAGYARSTANTDIYRILRVPDIKKIIQKNDDMFHIAIHESAMRAMEIKQHRAFYDPIDYFEKKQETRITRDGGEYTVEVMGLKDFKSMTPEQRMCIDGMEVKGQASIPVYLMPDRGKELNDIIKIDSDYSKALADTGEEETREIIMGRITIRETKRAQRPADIEYEIVERPTSTGDEDEEEDD